MYPSFAATLIKLRPVCYCASCYCYDCQWDDVMEGTRLKGELKCSEEWIGITEIESLSLAANTVMD